MYWKMYERRSCVERKSGPNRKHNNETLQSGYPFEKISLDVKGPLPSGRHGEKYILGIRDNFTRYASLIPLRKATVVEVTRALYENHENNRKKLDRCIINSGDQR